VDNLRTAAKRDYGGPLVRLHVGLEDPEDLIADLASALTGYPVSA
jgi:cystathionine beta-lyase